MLKPEWEKIADLKAENMLLRKGLNLILELDNTLEESERLNRFNYSNSDLIMEVGDFYKEVEQNETLLPFFKELCK